MTALFDALSEEIFQILKGSGKVMTLYDEDGNKTYEPKTARRMFAKPENMMLSIIEAGVDSEVKLYLSKSNEISQLSSLINTLRRVTTRYNVLFNVRKFGRELQPKDFAYQAAISESSMWGTTKTSYQKIGSAKMIIRHCAPVLESVMGSRGRNILNIFVESKHGERFRFPVNHLAGGRAFAQHVNQGGNPYDSVGSQIVAMANESQALTKANRYIYYSRNSLNEDAISLRVPIKQRIFELRRAFNSLSKPNGYSRIVESGLPASTDNLFESNNELSQEIERIQELLKIDTNHALAESLMPVALLTLGENMTDKINEMFHGVISLEDGIAESLVEALIDEYGYDVENMSRFGSNIAFCESHVFEDAQRVLELLEAEYQLNENDAFLNYAKDWSEHRFSMSGKDEFIDPKEKKEFEKGIVELADGLRDIVSGNFKIPDYPEFAPEFTDENARHRYYLDLFVSQDSLSNIATLNYVSTIIDKMADGKKLDAAEKTISDKLISALESDLYGDEEMEEGHSGEDLQIEEESTDVVKEEIPAPVGIGDHVATTKGPAIVVDVEENMATLEFINGTTDTMAFDDMEKIPMLGSMSEEAELSNWFNNFTPSSVLDEVNFDHGVVRQPKKAVPGFDSTIRAGDRVAHKSYGGGEVISTNGRLSKVVFDRPHARLPADRTVSIMNGALHKAGSIRKVQDSVDPMSEDKKGPCWDGYKMVGMKKKGGKTVPDCVPESQDLDEISKDAAAKYFHAASNDRGQADRHAALTGDASRLARRDRGLRLAFRKMEEGVSLPSESLDAVFDEAKFFAEKVLNNPEEHGLEVPFGTDDRDEMEMDFMRSFSEMIADHIKDLLRHDEIQRSVNFDENLEEAGSRKPNTITYWLEDEEADKDYELEIEYTIDDGSFATGLDYPKFHSYGEVVEIQGILNKTTGEDVDFDDLPQEDQDRITQECKDDARQNAEDAAEWRAEMARDARYDESGDIGQSLINDVKVKDDLSKMTDDQLKSEYKNAWKTRGTLQALNYMDEIKAELSKRGQTVESIEESAEIEDLLKNAFFRK